MIIEEILPFDYAPVTAASERLLQQQASEREQRNAEGVRRWYGQTFGPVVGSVLANESSRVVTP